MACGGEQAGVFVAGTVLPGAVVTVAEGVAKEVLGAEERRGGRGGQFKWGADG